MIGLEIKKVSFSYFNGMVLDNISLIINAGERVGLLGPNGSGKSTLLKLASGILKPKYGKIMLGESNLSRLNRKMIARHIAVVPQQVNIPFAFSVEEVVALGRIPFLNPLTEESETDKKIMVEAMAMAGVINTRERKFDELSGGERQKVVIAMALAQQPELLLLDEPTVHLDINHQVQVLEMVRNLNTNNGITVIAAMHDLNLAAAYFNRLILLNKGTIVSDGEPATVLTAINIENVYRTRVRVEVNPLTRIPRVDIMTTSCSQ